MSEMPLSREDARRWCAEIGKLMGKSDPDLRLRLGSIRDGFRRLLSAPTLDRSAYGELCSRAYLVYIEAAARDFEMAKKRKSQRLVLDTDESVIVYSEKGRKSGEADLMAERGRQGKEEAYLFMRLGPVKGGKTRRSVWIEVGNRETCDSASISIFQLAAIIKRHADEGEVIEASLYHYHPDPHAADMAESRISPADLLFAARYCAIFGHLIPVPLDFRVVNRDGIYSFWGVTFDKLISMGGKGLCRLDTLQGLGMASFLARYGIYCSFERIPGRMRPHRIKK